MSDYEAKEAQRLLDDDFLARVFGDVRQDALEELASAKGDDILRLQAFVAAVDAIRDDLRAMTFRAEPVTDQASPFA